MKLFGAIAISLLSSAVFAQSQSTILGGWKGFSDPEILGSNFTHVMSSLPLEGSIEDGTKGWSGHYWPSNEAGINIRWNSPNREKFKYKSPSKTTIMSMTQDQIAQLSPSEKYDLYMGRYNYPLKSEAGANTSHRAPDWAGICHGWAPASIHHNEPTPKVVANPDGIEIPFASADIKALLSYYYAFHYEGGHAGQVGLRCFFGAWLGGRKNCNDDLNAGAFHIIIANQLGLMKKGLLMDKDRYKEVWNQPIVGYKTRIIARNLKPSRSAARRAVSEVRVATDLMFIDESDPTWDTVIGTENQKVEVMKLEYRLELSADGKIVGGEWESEERPDFLWDKVKTPGFDGDLSGIANLLND